ncbi:hypothetical protein Franean1_7064 [Parafrankia sp. EAN1pec]|uniref:transposase n=1 Tax=Parafrankia sp. (strain EAN1pec) TaxID=298653 RepID=UPI0000543C58|nr:hypothetical protein Franean1_7064 [Frankia sp. EAN1pec]
MVRFPVTACQPSPVRSQCTRATRNGRQLMLRPRDIHEAVEQARAKQNTDEWKQRPRLAHVLAATALNLIRLDAWWTGTLLDRPRASHLARLDFSLAA